MRTVEIGEPIFARQISCGYGALVEVIDGILEYNASNYWISVFSHLLLLEVLDLRRNADSAKAGYELGRLFDRLRKVVVRPTSA